MTSLPPAIKPTLPSSSVLEPAQWPAFLALEFNGERAKTVLVKCQHKGPLYVQKAFYPEAQDCAHVYLLHPPGGIVSGDFLDISLQLHHAAHVLLTTPGATRLYRARQDQADQAPLAQKVINRISVFEQSRVEWLPSETIVFDGACIDLSTDIELHDDSQFCGWEITCLGLQASKEPFVSGRFSQTFSVSQSGVPKVLDRMAFNADSHYLSSRCGLQAKTVYGTLIAGPIQQDSQIDINQLLVQLRALFEEKRIDEQLSTDQCAVTIVNGFIICRYLGDCSDQARQYFIQAWKVLRPVLMRRQAVEPRIWAT